MRGTGGSGPEGYDAGPFVPAGGGLPELREAASGCEGCPLHAPATQTVFGRGELPARVVLIGEQPGDQEDKRGAPFVGPAGRVLARALAEAGIDPGEACLTNAVKHLKFTRSERHPGGVPPAALLAASVAPRSSPRPRRCPLTRLRRPDASPGGQGRSLTAVLSVVQ